MEGIFCFVPLTQPSPWGRGLLGLLFLVLLSEDVGWLGKARGFRVFVLLAKISRWYLMLLQRFCCATFGLCWALAKKG